MTGKSDPNQRLGPTSDALIPPQTGHEVPDECFDEPVAFGDTRSDLVPALVAQRGPDAAKRFGTFFTDNIRNPNTREAYHRNVMAFFAWCEQRGLDFTSVESFHVSAYIEQLTKYKAASSVKQSLASIRMLFDWLIVGQICRINPAQAVRGPKLVLKKGKTPVLNEQDAKRLIAGIDTGHVVGLRDRALVATLVYTFGRVGAVVKMNVEDFFPNGKRWFVRLHEKEGKHHQVPAHHKLEEYMDTYLTSAGIAAEKKSPLFRTTVRRTRRLTGNRIHRTNVWQMIRRRAKDVGIATPIGCHTFRATGITNYMQNGGTLETAQKMANHESARTTGLYDRSDDQLTVDEIERVTI